MARSSALVSEVHHCQHLIGIANQKLHLCTSSYATNKKLRPPNPRCELLILCWFSLSREPSRLRRVKGNLLFVKGLFSCRLKPTNNRSFESSSCRCDRSIESSVRVVLVPPCTTASSWRKLAAVTTFQIVSARGAQGDEVLPFEDLNLKVSSTVVERTRMSTQVTEGSLEGRSSSPQSEEGGHRSPSRSPSPPGQPDLNTASGGHAAEIGEFLSTP
jgi:hypothetical protein